MDFSGLLDADAGEIIPNSTAITVSAVDKDNTAAPTVIDQATKQVDPNNGAIAVIKVQAGVESESPYKITVLIVTSENNTLEQDVLLYVKDT